MADTSGAEPAPPLPRPPSDHDWRDDLAELWERLWDSRSRFGRAAGTVRSLRVGVVVLTGVLTAAALGIALAVLGRAGGPPPEELLPRVDVSVHAPSPTVAPIAVHVAGAVSDPGVHLFTTEVRVVDAIDAAGGPLPEADLDRLNLAAPVPDGARIHVPRVGEDPPAVIDVADADAHVSAGPLDLNTASASDLETLPGVGPATAAAIVAHRDRSGPFVSVDDLDDVAGIGPGRIEQIRPLVVVR